MWYKARSLKQSMYLHSTFSIYGVLSQFDNLPAWKKHFHLVSLVELSCDLANGEMFHWVRSKYSDLAEIRVSFSPSSWSQKAKLQISQSSQWLASGWPLFSQICCQKVSQIVGRLNILDKSDCYFAAYRCLLVMSRHHYYKLEEKSSSYLFFFGVCLCVGGYWRAKAD